MIDLTPLAGFPLLLNQDSLEVLTPGDVRFTRQSRTTAELRPILFEPQDLPSETAIYWNYNLSDGGRGEAKLKEFGLTFGLVCLPALKIGREYVKTHGHYHSTMPGSSIAFPEVYTHYFGELYLYMQRRLRGLASQLDDCMLYRMKPGHSITIPPGYAHILINPSNSPALMAGLYAQEAIHEYDPFREMGGGAYYFLEEGGKMKAIPNQRYAVRPELIEITDLVDTPFAPPNDNRPLWTAFVEEPQRFGFITNPRLARLQFQLEEQTQ